MTVSRRNEIEVAFDETIQGYFAIWEPVVIGAGKTRDEALNDLRQAAHFGVDTFIELKLKDIKDINEEKED